MLNREEHRRWLWCVGLTWAGFLVTVAAIVVGIWLQVDLPSAGDHHADRYFRLTVLLQSLMPVGIGLIVVGAARILAALPTRSTRPVVERAPGPITW